MINGTSRVVPGGTPPAIVTPACHSPEMGKTPAVRVAVVGSEGRSSGTWRIWTGREDIYVAPREDAGAYKVSLHPHGWRWAYTEDQPRGPGDFLPDVDVPPSGVEAGVHH